jgi:hypothetical protein
VWLTGSSAPGYYASHPDARKQKIAALAAYRRATAALRDATYASPFLGVLLANNNPAKTADCIDYLRANVADPADVHYVDRTTDLSTVQPASSATLTLWAPEEDTADYYGKFKPIAAGLGIDDTYDFDDLDGPRLAEAPEPKPLGGIDAGAFYNLLDVRRGATSTLLSIDQPRTNTSVVTLLEWNGWRLLFSGDAEKRSWRQMAKVGVVAPVHFLKVSHHGSHTGMPPDDILDDVLPRQRPAPPDPAPPSRPTRTPTRASRTGTRSMGCANASTSARPAISRPASCSSSSPSMRPGRRRRGETSIVGGMFVCRAAECNALAMRGAARPSGRSMRRHMVDARYEESTHADLHEGASDGQAVRRRAAQGRPLEGRAAQGRPLQGRVPNADDVSKAIVGAATAVGLVKSRRAAGRTSSPARSPLPAVGWVAMNWSKVRGWLDRGAARINQRMDAVQGEDEWDETVAFTPPRPSRSSPRSTPSADGLDARRLPERARRPVRDGRLKARLRFIVMERAAAVASPSPVKWPAPSRSRMKQALRLIDMRPGRVGDLVPVRRMPSLRRPYRPTPRTFSAAR